MNHRWKDNQCIRCGITREKREAKVRVGFPYSVLDRHGVWVDRQRYDYRWLWWYGDKYKFDRPDCIQIT